MSQAIPGASTAEAMNEYINVINEESSKLNSGDLADVSNEELMAYLDKIRKKETVNAGKENEYGSYTR